jgi:flagellar transcriptional activator FlhD
MGRFFGIDPEIMNTDSERRACHRSFCGAVASARSIEPKALFPKLSEKRRHDAMTHTGATAGSPATVAECFGSTECSHPNDPPESRSVKMKFENLLSEVREANLSYLMLARQMIVADKAQATFRLGIDTDLADMIASLSSAQLLKIASSNMLLCRFRFDDRTVWDLITSHSKDRETGMGSVHAAILLGSRSLEAA